jgi:rod shape-determining protein MreB
VGGDKIDEVIVTYVKRKYNLQIGARTAEEIKVSIGSALPLERELEMEVRGLDQVENLPKSILLTSSEVTEAIAEPLRQIVSSARKVMEETPPELASDIVDRGMLLTGGGSLLRNLDRLFAQEIGVPAFVAEDPLSCVAIGAGRAMEHFAFYKDGLDTT